MNQCPACDYLVPAAWSQCRRCGASLTSAVAVLARNEVAATRLTLPRPDLAVVKPRHAPPPISTSARPYTPPSRDDGAVAAPRRARSRIPLIGPLCVALVVGSVWLAWQRVQHPPVPSELKAWITQDAGAIYRPPGTPLSVSLPGVPQESTSRVTFGPGSVGSARVATVDAGAYHFEVVWLAAPAKLLAQPGLTAEEHAAEYASRAGGFRLLVQKRTEHAHRPAVRAVIERAGEDGRALVVLDGNMIYAVVAHSTSESTAGFDHLVETFELGAMH